MTNSWLLKKAEDPEFRREFEAERLILAATEALCDALEKEGVSRAELARRVGTSRSNVTQCLSGTRNLTLRSLATFGHELGYRFTVASEPLRTGVFFSSPMCEMRDLTTSSRPTSVARLADLEERIEGVEDEAPEFLRLAS